MLASRPTSSRSERLYLGLQALAPLPGIRPGDDLGELLASALPLALAPGDILVVAHKVVSKSEGRVRRLHEIEPSPRASRLASQAAKDPRVVQAVLDESVRIVRAERGVLIAETRHGYVCANAGVDASNAESPDELILLPLDPDASARGLRAALGRLTGTLPGVIVSDSFGRAWRIGQTDVAIGAAGVAVLDDWRGRRDSAGRELHATMIAAADAIAGAADLVRRKDSRQPAVLVRGLDQFVCADDGPGATSLRRPADQDLFR